MNRWPAAALPGVALALSLGACSTLPPSDAVQADRLRLYEARKSSLSEQDSWSLEGRLAVNDGKDGGSGRFHWNEQSGSSRMDFHGALGRGAWRLIADADGAVLERADGARYEASSVGELVRGQVGWDIPVEALAWWIRGLEAPGGVQSRALDDTGRLVELRQQDWSIEFGRYREFGSLELPVKMTARQADRSVKLAVRSWTLLADEPVDE